MATGNSVGEEFAFISYADADSSWAEWLAWQLEEAGVAVRSYSWDAVPGSSRIDWLDHTITAAKCAFIVLSQAYLDADGLSIQWQAMFDRTVNNLAGKLVPVKVDFCRASGLLGSLVSINLVGLDEGMAKSVLGAGVRALDQGSYRPKRPDSPPPFPGGRVAGAGPSKESGGPRDGQGDRSGAEAANSSWMTSDVVSADAEGDVPATPAAAKRIDAGGITLRAKVSGGGRVYQAGRDQYFGDG